MVESLLFKNSAEAPDYVLFSPPHYDQFKCGRLLFAVDMCTELVTNTTCTLPDIFRSP